MKHLDLESLSETVVGQEEKQLKKEASASDRVPFSGNEYRFNKIAFDMWHLKDEPEHKIWILEQGDDGVEYLSRHSDYESKEQLVEAQPNWSVQEDENIKTVTLSYGHIPVAKFSSAEFEFDKDSVHPFKESLLESVRKEANVKTLLANLSENHKEQLLEKFPELS